MPVCSVSLLPSEHETGDGRSAKDPEPLIGTSNVDVVGVTKAPMTEGSWRAQIRRLRTVRWVRRLAGSHIAPPRRVGGGRVAMGCAEGSGASSAWHEAGSAVKTHSVT